MLVGVAPEVNLGIIGSKHVEKIKEIALIPEGTESYTTEIS